MSQMMTLGFKVLKKTNTFQNRLEFRDQNNQNLSGIPE